MKKNIIKNTLKEYIRKYDNSFWKRLDYKYNLQLFDKINKTKNITTSHGPDRTTVASNGRYKYIEMIKYIILIEGDIEKKMLQAFI